MFAREMRTQLDGLRPAVRTENASLAGNIPPTHSRDKKFDVGKTSNYSSIFDNKMIARIQRISFRSTASRVQCIQNFNRPTTSGELSQFFDVINFYHSTIPHAVEVQAIKEER